jgi:hypothetical protein
MPASTLRTTSATFFLLMSVAFTQLTAGEGMRVGFNGGYAVSVTDFDPGGDERIDALFVAVEWERANGFLMQLSLSRGSQDGFAFFDLDFDGQIDAVPLSTDSSNLRAAFVAGYRWNKNGTVRPQLYGGLSQIEFERKIEGIAVSDDSSNSFVVGFGVIVGNEHHFLTFDYINDLDHEVDQVFSTAKESFEYREIRLGWMYRW